MLRLFNQSPKRANARASLAAEISEYNAGDSGGSDEIPCQWKIEGRL